MINQPIKQDRRKMEAVINPMQYLKRWIKPSPIADVTHCIIRFDGTLLIAYCGCKIPLTDACLPIKGARHCVNCEELRRKHLRERSAHVANGK
jgi:hypothetical protein